MEVLPQPTIHKKNSTRINEKSIVYCTPGPPQPRSSHHNTDHSERRTVTTKTLLRQLQQPFPPWLVQRSRKPLFYYLFYFISFFPNILFLDFDGRIIIHDHIPSNTLRALSPLPSHLTRYVLFLCPFHLPSINLFTSISSSLFTFSTHKRAPCFSHLLEFQVYLRFLIPLLPFPKIPSTALRYDYLFKFQKWNFQQPSLSEIRIISIPKSNNHLYKTQNVN